MGLGKLKLSPATFISGRDEPVESETKTSFSNAKISLAGILGGRDGTADERHHEAFKIERTEGPALYGDYIIILQENGYDFNLEIGLFGYYAVDWSGLIGVYYFGDLDPAARLHFSRAECLSVQKLIRSFFSEPEVLLKKFLRARFLGRIDFRPDWIIESSNEQIDFSRWSAQDLVNAKRLAKPPYTSFTAGRIGFGGAVRGADEKIHTLFEIERLEWPAKKDFVLFGEYVAVFPSPDDPCAFNIEIAAFGYVNSIDAGDLQRLRDFTADECSAVEFIVRSFFSNPAVFKGEWDVKTRFLGGLSFRSGWIIKN
jgi:hypothetical protein